MNKVIKHIDGLSGQEEQLALKELNYQLDPIVKQVDTFTRKYICPYCKDIELNVYDRMTSPDDYDWVAECPNCKERWDS